MDRLEQLKLYLRRYGQTYRAYHNKGEDYTFSTLFESNENLRFWIGETNPVAEATIGDFWYHGGNLERLRPDGSYRPVVDYYEDIPTSIINLGDDFFSTSRFIMSVQIVGTTNVRALQAVPYTLQGNWSDDTSSVLQAGSWQVQATPGYVIPNGTTIVRNAKGGGNFRAGLDSSNNTVELVAVYGSLVARLDVKIKGAVDSTGGNPARVEIVGPTDVNEETTAQYVPTIVYADNNRGSVIDPAWNISPVAAGSIDGNGVLQASATDADIEAVISCYAPQAVGGPASGTLAVVIRDTAITNTSAPRWGVGAPGLNSWADFKNFTGRGTAGDPEAIFNLAAAPGQKMYYLYPVALGLIEITTLDDQKTESWTAGGVGGFPRKVMLTDDYGHTVEFYVFETVKSGLPSSVWKAAFPVDPPIPEPGSKTVTAFSQAATAALQRPSGVLGVAAVLSWDPTANRVRLVSEAFADGYDPANDPVVIRLYDPAGNRVVGELAWTTGTTWEGTWVSGVPLMQAMQSTTQVFAARFVEIPVDAIEVDPPLFELEVEESTTLVNVVVANVKGSAPNNISVLSSTLPAGLTLSFRAAPAPTPELMGTLVLNGPAGVAGTSTADYRLLDQNGAGANFSIKLVATPVTNQGIQVDPSSAVVPRDVGATLVNFTVGTVLYQPATSVVIQSGALPPGMGVSYVDGTDVTNPSQRGRLVVNGGVGNIPGTFTAQIRVQDALGYTFGFTLSVQVNAIPIDPTIAFDPVSFVKQLRQGAVVDEVMTTVLFAAPVGALQIQGVVPEHLTVAFVAQTDPDDADVVGVIKLTGTADQLGAVNLIIKGTDAGLHSATLSANVVIEALPEAITVDPTSWTGTTQPNTSVDQKLANVYHQTPISVTPTGLPSTLIVQYVPSVGADNKVGELWLRGSSGASQIVDARVVLADAYAATATFQIGLTVEPRRIQLSTNIADLVIDEDQVLTNRELAKVLNVAASSVSVVEGTLPAGLTLSFLAISAQFPTVGAIVLNGKTDVVGARTLKIRATGGTSYAELVLNLTVNELAAIEVAPTTVTENVVAKVATELEICTVSNRVPVSVVASASLQPFAFEFKAAANGAVSGVILMKGVQAVAGNQVGTVTMTDKHGRTAVVNLTVVVAAQQDLTLTPTTAAIVVEQGKPLTQAISSVQNRIASLVSVVPALPAGVTVSVVQGGVYPITGAVQLVSDAAVLADATYVITVKDDENNNVTMNLEYVCEYVPPAVSVTPSGWVGTLEVDLAVDQQVAVVLHELPTLALSSGIMPAGVSLVLEAATDAGNPDQKAVLKLVGTPTTSGNTEATFTLTGSRGTASFKVTATTAVASAMDVVSAALNGVAPTGETVDLRAATVLNREPTSVVVALGQLPAGLAPVFVADVNTVDRRTGYIQIQGVTTETGSHTATIRVTDAMGTSKDVVATVTGQTFMTATPAAVNLEVPYGDPVVNTRLFSVTGQVPTTVTGPEGFAGSFRIVGNDVQMSWTTPEDITFDVKATSATGRYVVVPVTVTIGAAPDIEIDPEEVTIYGAVGYLIDETAFKAVNVGIESIDYSPETAFSALGLDAVLVNVGNGNVRITGTPVAGSEGQHLIPVTANGPTSSATCQITVDINNDVPFTVAPATAELEVNEGEEVDSKLFDIEGAGEARRLKVLSALPAGISLEIRGTEVWATGSSDEVGEYLLDIEISNNAVTETVSLTLEVKLVPLVLTPATTRLYAGEGLVVQAVLATSNLELDSFEVLNGTLPSGIAVSVVGKELKVSGVAQTTGIFSPTIRVKSGAKTADFALTMEVGDRSTALILVPRVGQLEVEAGTPVNEVLSISTQVQAASVTVVSGSLPQGMAITLVQKNETVNKGELVLQGSPAEEGVWATVVDVKDASGLKSDQFVLALVVQEASVPGTLKLDTNEANVDRFDDTPVDDFVLATATQGTPLTVEYVGGSAFNLKIVGTSIVATLPPPTLVGDYQGLYKVTGDIGVQLLTINLVVERRPIPVLDPNAADLTVRVGEAIDAELVATLSGDTLVSVSVKQGQLPAGTTLDVVGQTIVLNGEATATGSNIVVYEATCEASTIQGSLKVLVLGEGVVVDPVNAQVSLREGVEVSNQQVADVYGPATAMTQVSGVLPTGVTVTFVEATAPETVGTVQVSGTPTVPGTSSVVFQLSSTDSNAELTIDFTVIPKFAVVPASKTLAGNFGDVLTNSVLTTAANGVPTGVNPTNVGSGITLSIVGQTIVANGTVTSASTALIPVTVTSSEGLTAELQLQMALTDQRVMVLTPDNGASVIELTVSQDYKLCDVSGVVPASVALTSGNPVPGLTVSVVGNQVRATGTPTATGVFDAVYTVTGENGATRTLTWKTTVNGVTLAFNPASVTGTVGVGIAKTFDVVATKGTVASTTSTLPAWAVVTHTASSVKIVATAPATGTFTGTVVAKNDTGVETTIPVTLNSFAALTVTPTTVEANAEQNTPFDAEIAAFDQYLESSKIVVTGNVPAGTTVSTVPSGQRTGVKLSGAATTVGNYVFTVTGTDDRNFSAATQVTVTVTAATQITVTPTAASFTFDVGQNVDQVVATTGPVTP